MIEDKEEKTEEDVPEPKTDILVSETTLRKIFNDYINHRPKYEDQMVWQSEFSNLRIVVGLESKPFTQESLGYKLLAKGYNI